MELDEAYLNPDPGETPGLAQTQPGQPFDGNQATVERWTVMLEQILEALIELDPTGCCRYANRQAEVLFGLPRSQIIGRPLEHLLPHDLVPQIHQQCQQVLADQMPAELDAIFYAPSEKFLKVRLFPAPTGLMAYFQDVTAQQKLETSLRQEQEFLQVLLDNVQAGIVACDAEGRLKLFNRAARSFHGVSESPLPPEQWAEQYHLYRPDGQTLMPTAEIPLFRAWQGQTVHDVEMMIRSQPDHARIVSANGQAIVDPTGAMLGAVVVMHDITERKRIEQALRDSEAQLSGIFQTIPDGIVIVNSAGQIIAANAAAERILRLTRRSIVERAYNDPDWSITTADGQPFPEDELPFVQVMRTGQPVYGVEHAITHTDGTRIILSINASPSFDPDGQINSVVAALIDITKLKQTEAELRASETRYRTVIETAAEGIVLQHITDGIITCNANAEQMLGLTADQITGRTSLDPQWQAIYEDGSPFPGEYHPAMITLRTGEPQSNVVMGIRKPDDSLTWLSINSRPLWQPNESTPSSVVVSFFDVTERKRAEEALRTTEQRYRSVVDSLKEVIFQVDGSGQWSFLNPAWAEMTGFSVNSCIGTAVVNYLHPDDQQQHHTQMQALLSHQREDCRYEIRFLTHTGDHRWVEVFARYMEDDQQTAVISGTLNDVTERRLAEKKRLQLLQEQTARTVAETAQQQSAFLAEVSSVLATSLDYEQTLQSIANLTVPYFADWCSIDLLNDDCSISRVAVAHADPNKVAFGWEISRRFPRHLDDGYGISHVMQTGQLEAALTITDEQLAAAIHDPDYLSIVQSLGIKSGIIAPLQARNRVLGSISFVLSDSQRYYTMADVAMAEDLARRAAIALENASLYQATQAAQAAAEAAANRTARLLSVMTALSESLTPAQVSAVILEQATAALQANAGLIALLNPNHELEIVQTLNYDEASVATQQTFPLDAPFPLAEAVRTGQPVWLETTADRIARYPNLAQSYRQMAHQAWISVPLLIKGRAVGGLSLSFLQVPEINDDEQTFLLALVHQSAQAIERAQLYESEQRARAEAESANRLKDEFLAVLSHELRSPLNPILGWSKLLQTQKLDAAKTAQALATIERNAKLQSELIEDLLDVSRILQGKLSLAVAPVNLVATTQAAIETVRLAAEAKSIAIAAHLDPAVDWVMGDANRLQQVLWNLLSNAVKFTPAGGQIEVRVEPMPAAQAPMAQITVTDTGKGILPQFLPHVFDYFRQADATITRQFGGLGLGLAIVRHLVELHGGNVQASSAGENCGATFTVQLPLRPSPSEATPGAGQELTGLDSKPLAGLRILIVDDDADTRDFVAFAIEQAGAEVFTAASAPAALALFDQAQPDVLLSDIGMPEMDGYTLMRQIRLRPPAAGGQIPAIALTAYAGEINQQQVLAAGFQQHLAKPVEPHRLIASITTLIQR